MHSLSKKATKVVQSNLGRHADPNESEAELAHIVQRESCQEQDEYEERLPVEKVIEICLGWLSTRSEIAVESIHKSPENNIHKWHSLKLDLVRRGRRQSSPTYHSSRNGS